LTSDRARLAELGARAMRILLDLVEEPGAVAASAQIGAELVVRSSA